MYVCSRCLWNAGRVTAKNLLSQKPSAVTQGKLLGRAHATAAAALERSSDDFRSRSTRHHGISEAKALRGRAEEAIRPAIVDKNTSRRDHQTITRLSPGRKTGNRPLSSSNPPGRKARKSTELVSRTDVQSGFPTEEFQDEPSPAEDGPASLAGNSQLDKVAESTELKKRMIHRLKYVRDPYHLANDVQGTLKKGRYEEALMLTQLASRTASCTVAWNHLIDHLMGRGRTRQAFKLFNDV
jgi:hypothetical protein